ncbi:MAG: hypothetical protein Unbinned4409contig1001_59 [Prokaryotic dsDNA virus sp.]|nr:MAG: hypothetical protein Unbinned4409contig1001_59 [Prokaryotic dsDNA virus sp.]|tara:strand:+ start:141 stop:389 length:249 start_codon:yes stop_codon:yes gene_type:complete
MSIWKQERIDGVMREIAERRPEEIAEIILKERFDRRVSEYECDWLDKLANALRDGDMFNEMQLMTELYLDPKKELIKRYKDQ